MRITSCASLVSWAIGVAAWGCAASADDPVTSESGGSSNASGGASMSTGASPSTGGLSATGGTVSTGGNSAGGSFASGGASTTLPTGGAPPSGGSLSTGGSTGGSYTGGVTGTGGIIATGGTSSTGGSTTGTGGSTPTGGSTSFGGRTGFGGSTSVGGRTGFGGSTSTGGTTGFGGRTGSGGDTSTGGNTASGGSTTGTGGGSGETVDCNAAMPTDGTPHSGPSSQGNAAGQSWSLWQNGSGGSITTYSTPAFSAEWGPNSGDFLVRLGLEWGNNGKPYEDHGVIEAKFSYKKTGTGGGYSYIGIYGWSNNPCVEWYIVDDSFNNMPFNAYNSTQKGTVSIDGENYKLFSNRTKGTGGSRCTGVTEWDQFWSIRQKARQCGIITISQHFDAWKAAGMAMGNLLEAKILMEVGGGTGTVQFPVAQVTSER